MSEGALPVEIARGESVVDRGCELEVPKPCGLFIFGASGDLTRGKLMPALYRLERHGLLPERFFVMGLARSEMSDGAFRDAMGEAVRDAGPQDFDEDSWRRFAGRLYYSVVDYGDPASFRGFARRCGPLEEEHRTGGNRIFYLAVPPTVYEGIITNLGEAGLSGGKGEGYTHVVIEKPFGRDLRSAARLNSVLLRHFREDQIYRMDHYLAKETVQSILMFRFANSIFEPLWNRRYVDHVQITVAENIGIGKRGGYYDRSGVLRDMFQNHLFQLLALTAMEPPSAFEADRVRDEKVKVLRSVRPFPLKRLRDNVAVGQYGGGVLDGEEVRPYREEPKVAPDSTTPTYAALRVFIDNWRWNGVPFYLRSGKRLARKKAEISIHYRPVPHQMFASTLEERIEPNVLVLRIQPDEGISLFIQTKNPGSRVCLRPVLMDFSYPKVFTLSAYERILHDCMQGDQMLFVRQDGADAAWALLTPVIEELEAGLRPEGFPNYAAGSEGPREAAALIEKDGRLWRPI
ncbi:MAG: glucose-6-phosphate dehydrogenase [Thermodesulfovibrionales bacterium]